MTKKTSVLLVEDDIDTVRFLKNIIEKKIDNVNVIGSTDNVEESITFIKENRPEIILMDIILNNGNAFSILDAFPNPDFEVIFISAHGEYMEKALEYYALNFLTKPIDSLRLIGIFRKYRKFKQRIFESHKYEMLKEMVHENGQKFLLYVGKKHIAISFSDVIRCTADGNYTLFYLSDKRTLLASKPLGYYSDLLERKNFFRTSRFDLINLKHIISIYKKETIILSNKDKINISNRNRSKLITLIKELSL